MIYSTHLLRHVRFTIGQTIQRQRTARRMPLLKLSRLTQIDPLRLDQLELGKSEIRLDELLKIGCALNIVWSELPLEAYSYIAAQ